MVTLTTQTKNLSRVSLLDIGSAYIISVHRMGSVIMAVINVLMTSHIPLNY